MRERILKLSLPPMSVLRFQPLLIAPRFAQLFSFNTRHTRSNGRGAERGEEEVGGRKAYVARIDHVCGGLRGTSQSRDQDTRAWGGEGVAQNDRRYVLL